MTSGQGIPIGDLRILHSGSSPLRWAGLLTPVFTLLTRDRRQGWAVCGASAWNRLLGGMVRKGGCRSKTYYGSEARSGSTACR